MGLKDRRVRVIKPCIGGGFGSKLDTYAYEYIAILLAFHTRRPVKIEFDRSEEFIATSTRQPTVTYISQGCDAEGKLLFRDIRMILDNGAYTSWGATTPSVMMMPITTLYRVPNVRYEAKCVYTNNTYAQAMRGYGNPQATFAIESTIDMLAEAAGIDPVDVPAHQRQPARRRLHPGAENHHLRPDGVPGHRHRPARAGGAQDTRRGDRFRLPDPRRRRGPGLQVRRLRHHHQDGRLRQGRRVHRCHRHGAGHRTRSSPRSWPRSSG